jgi:hypothetical protein
MNRKKNSPFLFLVLYLISVLFVFSLFEDYDWNYGKERTGLLLFLFLLSSLLYFHRSYITNKKNLKKLNFSPTGLLFFTALILSVQFFNETYSSVKKIQETNEIPLDQGQNVYRAWQLLKKGISPYRTDLLLDLDLYYKELRQNPSSKKCLKFKTDISRQMVSQYWDSLDLELGKKLIPEVHEAEACKKERLIFSSLGYKYGPALIGIYAPFFQFFDKSGIFLAHLSFLILFLICFFWFYQKELAENPIVGVFTFILILWPAPLLKNGFINSANDLIGTVLALTALILFHKKSDKLYSPFLLALSIACKTLPGLAFIPLLYFFSWKQRASFFLFSVFFFSPFLILDFEGVLNNLFYFNFIRSSDSTALSYFVSKESMFFFKLFSLFFIGWFWRKLNLKVFNLSAFCLFVLSCLTLILCISKVFHNNYLVWIQIFIGYCFFIWFTQNFPNKTRGYSSGKK